MKILIAFAITLLSAGLAMACQCPSGGTARSAAEASPNIAIFRLMSVDRSGEPDRYESADSIRRVTLRVERVFKGDLKPGEEFIVGQGGGASCGWKFDESGIGTDYLFYMDAKPAAGFGWGAPSCQRHMNAAAAVADILYLEKLDKVAGQTRISGRLVDSVSYPGGKTIFTPFADTTVRISGAGRTIRVKTNKDGVYEVYGLPPGKYRIAPESADGSKFALFQKANKYKFRLLANDHVEFSFHHLQ